MSLVRSNPAGACAAAVASGVSALNGGATGTDSMAVTCTDGTTCTETFDIDFAKQ